MSHAKGIASCVVSTVLAIFFTGCYRAPVVPISADSKFFPKWNEVDFQFANPRGAGPARYRNAGKVSTVRITPSDTEEHLYAVAAVVFVRLRSGQVVIPWMRRETVLHGGERGPDEIIPPIGGSLGEIALPTSGEVDSYILLFSALDEETGWRYIEIKGPRSAATSVPDLLTLPRLEDRPDAKVLWKVFEEANAAFRAAGGKSDDMLPKSMR